MFLGALILLSISMSWICLSDDAAFARRRTTFTVFVGKDRRLKTITTTFNLPPGDTYLSDGTLSVTLISPANYKLRKLDTSDSYYLDRSYTLVNVPGAVRNKVWIVGLDDDKLNSSDKFVQFSIDDTARVHVLYDGNAVSLPSWMTTLGFINTGTFVTTDNPSGETLVIYRAVMPKGIIQLGGNNGSVTGARCNYVVVVRRPVAGDQATEAQIAATQMQLPRTGHRLVTLNSGKVLIAGGFDTTNALVSTCELYDSVSQTFTTTGALPQGRINPAMVKLNDGRVMVIGGDLGGTPTFNDGKWEAYGIAALAECEIYDPVAGTWSVAAGMATGRRLPEAIKLSDGRIFVSGGVQDTNGHALASTEIYDPSTATWTSGPAMQTSLYGNPARYGHRMALLSDGRVLIAGGLGVLNGPDLGDQATTECEIFDPVANTMTTVAPMNTPRGRFGFVDIGGGKFLAIGGLYYQRPSPPASWPLYLSTSDVEMYNAAANVWTPVMSLPRAMYDFAVSSPGADRALVFDGYDVVGTDAGEIFLYDGILNNWTLVGNLVTSRSFPFSNGSSMVADLGGKEYFLAGGVHFDEATAQTTLLYTGERFKY